MYKKLETKEEYENAVEELNLLKSFYDYSTSEEVKNKIYILELTIKDYLDSKEDSIDKALMEWLNARPNVREVMIISKGSNTWTALELLEEFKNKTPVALELKENIISLTIDLLFREKVSLNDTKGEDLIEEVLKDWLEKSFDAKTKVLYSKGRNWTASELLEEFKNKTPFANEYKRNLIYLTIDLLFRGEKTL